MNITQSYLKQKSIASRLLLERMSAIHREVANKTSRVEGISSINELSKGLTIKKSVIDVLMSLHDPKHTRTTDNVFKAINSAMYYCAQKPTENDNKVMQSLFKARLSGEQIDSVRELLKIIRSEPNKERRVLTASRMLGQFVRERSSRIAPDNVENIVLAGGGAKGFSLSKIPGAIESRGVNNIKRIAGTSAGAILGSMMAFGYDSKELEDIILSNQFGLFTVDSRFSNRLVNGLSDKLPVSLLKPFSDNAYAKTYHLSYVCEMLFHAAKDNNILPSELSERIEQVADKFNDLDDQSSQKDILTNRRKMHKKLYKEIIKPLFLEKEKANSILEKLLAIPDEIRRDISGIATQITELSFDKGERHFTQLYPSTEQGLRFAVREMSGQDIIVGYFEDLIEAKLEVLSDQDKRAVFLGPEFKNDLSQTVTSEQLRRVTFSQLKKLHEMHPKDFKEFYCTIALTKPNSPNNATSEGLFYAHHDVSHQHPDLKGMAVADAVRVSMNLPGIYPAYDFSVNGKHYKGADGGVLSNLSIHVFDDQFPPEKSMCFIYATDKEISKAENLYQILVHPRSSRDINRDIDVVKGALSELSTKRQKFSRIVSSQQSKKAKSDTVMVDKMVAEAQSRVEALTDKMDTLRFRRQVLDYELQNAKTRSWLPFSVADQLANKRHRGQYLPQDLNRTVLINTGSVGTLDFKISQSQKHALMAAGEKAVLGVLSGKDDLELSFLRDKCEDFELKLAQEKLVHISRHIWNREAPTDGFNKDIEFAFSHAYSTIKDKSKLKVLQADIEEALTAEDSRLSATKYNKSLVVARNLWRDVLTYESNRAIPH